jgi:hypothetical protein
VVSTQKISDLAGNFTATIDNLDEFGGATAGLGDLDGAGPSVAAVAVGASGDDDGGTNRGCVYILFLNSAGSTLSYTKISSTTANFTTALHSADEFGSSIAFLGDLDGPGPSVAAIAVGCPLDDDGGTDRGAVYIIFLSSAGTVLSYQKISDLAGDFTAPLHTADEFGGAVAALGDLDGPGPAVATLAVGAIGDDDGGALGADRGATYMLFLARTGKVLSYQKISDTQGNFTATLDDADQFGTSVAGLGDLDGAGPSAGAVAVGASFDDDGGTDHGAVYVLFLDTTGMVLSYQKISDTQGNFPPPLHDSDEFGGAVAALGDLDVPGPSVAALAVGAGGDDDGGVDRGAVYVLFLGATGNTLSYQKISNTQGNFTGVLHDGDDFGTALAVLGDIDGAGTGGKLALAIGAPGDDDGGGGRGAIYVCSIAGVTWSDVHEPPPGAAMNSLGHAKPNPFNPRTTLPFRIGTNGKVQIDICNIEGRLVRTLVLNQAEPGQHEVAWDGMDDSGRPLASGTYVYRMSVNGQRVAASEKAILLK